MARPLPPKDPQAVADLVERAKEARARLPGIVQQIEDLIRTVDPIELLSQLTLLFQTHRADEQPNRDESARWQVRIEWLTWLVFSRGLTAPTRPEVIDARILDPLERLLEEYVFTVTMTLPEPVEGLSEAQDEVRSLIQLESIHVRGEAFQCQLESLAVELYSPHEEWCVRNLGFTVQEAFALARMIGDCFAEKMHSLREAEAEVVGRMQADPAVALTLALPPSITEALAEGLPNSGLDDFGKSIGMVWFFSKSPEMVGFTLDEILDRANGKVDPARVPAFLDFASTRAEDIRGEPDLLALAARRQGTSHSSRRSVLHVRPRLVV
jgi:hypothetical protein